MKRPTSEEIAGIEDRRRADMLRSLSHPNSQPGSRGVPVSVTAALAALIDALPTGAVVTFGGIPIDHTKLNAARASAETLLRAPADEDTKTEALLAGINRAQDPATKRVNWGEGGKPDVGSIERAVSREFPASHKASGVQCASDVRVALRHALNISSDHDHRSWKDIERAIDAVLSLPETAKGREAFEECNYPHCHCPRHGRCVNATASSVPSAEGK